MTDRCMGEQIDSTYDLSGKWQVDIHDGNRYTAILPGTLDENQIGHMDSCNRSCHPENSTNTLMKRDRILTRYTRKYTYEGVAIFKRKVHISIPEGKRAFLEVERTRCLKVQIDGETVPEFEKGSLATPRIFEVTGKLHGDHIITCYVDNRYQGMPRTSILNSSMATDETQTNWNGILGYMRITVKEPVFVSRIRAYPVIRKASYKEDGSLIQKEQKMLKVYVTVEADRSYSGQLTLQSEALKQTQQRHIKVLRGSTEIVFDELPLSEEHICWDEEQGKLYQLSAGLSEHNRKQICFGIRFLSWNEEGRLTLNGRQLFLRGEVNCAVFPETGYPPMDVAQWGNVLQTYQAYGVNFVRFHSYCPPEAAFRAADQLGMLLQPELSNWNPKDAFETEESWQYYRNELQSILTELADHPSFIMLTLGNELKADQKGHARMDALLELAKRMDETRLFANGSNVEYGENGCDEKSDFYTSMKFYQEDLRGTFSEMEGIINKTYPGTENSYQKTLAHIRETYHKPVFGFETGQYEVLPDFHEIDEFHGVTRPDNLCDIRDRAEQKGLLANWDRDVEASGEMALLAYRQEVENVLRTKGMSGISLLGLQDFPGQGTALVGMINSHLCPKKYAFARPERFHSFFRSQLPLVRLPGYTFYNTQTLTGQIEIANYAKKTLAGTVMVELIAEETQKNIRAEGTDTMRETKDARQQRQILQVVECPPGIVTEAGQFEFSLCRYQNPVHLILRVGVVGTDCKNEYGIWVYPKIVQPCPKNVYETRVFDQTCMDKIREGGIIYFSPGAEELPDAVQTQFTPDFWSVGTFPDQSGAMGQLIREKHPVFRDFPTSFHSDWQWWPMACQRAVCIPQQIDPIIRELDSFATLRHMAKLFECRCGKARILFSTMDLSKLCHYPEGRALENSIYRYLESDSFEPEQSISEQQLRSLLLCQTENQ